MRWTDEATGLDCMIVQNQLNTLCGYVRVTDDHPLYGVQYTTLEREGRYFDVHGGLTFSGPIYRGDDLFFKTTNRPNWWFGFDAGHTFDYVPGPRPPESGIGDPEDYKGVGYMEEECLKLAAQLAAVSLVGRIETEWVMNEDMDPVPRDAPDKTRPTELPTP